MTVAQHIPPPLAAHTVSLLLSYLSALAGPLPSHLLSTPLKQRHHFLNLGNAFNTVEDIAAYLCWPNSTSSQEPLRVVNLLSDLCALSSLDLQLNCPTKYSYDGDALYAHAHILVNAPNISDDGLRLIFRCEPMHECSTDGEHADEWKYHDARLMPFPERSFDCPQGALLLPEVAGTQVSVNQHSGSYTNHQPYLEAEDGYWGLYIKSTVDDAEEQYGSYRPTVLEGSDDENAEDAYWAQYSSVHGTADSERHSPLPQKINDNAKIQSSVECISQPQPTIGCQYDSIDSLRNDSAFDDSNVPGARFEFTIVPGALPPDVLERRLSALSLDLSSSLSLEPSPPPFTSDTETPSIPGPFDLPHTKEVASIVDDIENKTAPRAEGASEDDNLIHSLGLRRASNPSIVVQGDTTEHGDNEGDENEILCEMIKGVYRLWRFKRRRGTGASMTDEKDAFISIVKETIQSI